MKTLFLLQFASFIFMLVCAFIIGVTRLQVRWVCRRYEQSRWLAFSGILGLAAQYFVQMRYGFRATGDDQGAVINVLVYMPCFTLISLAIYNIGASRARLRRMRLFCCAVYAAIVACFCAGYFQGGSLRIGAWLYAMLFLFAVSVVCCIGAIARGLAKWRGVLETMTGGDLVPYVRYARTSLLLLLLAALIMPFAIISSILLYCVAPFALFSLLFFVLSFVALGNSYVPTEELLGADEGCPGEPRAGTPGLCGEEGTGPARSHDQPCAGGRESASPLPEDRVRLVRERLDGWCAGLGYKDGTVNLLSLSHALHIPKDELSRYFDQCMGANFRMWLSDIRFRAAKRMMLEYPDYSNDVISSECGFSSRSHLYRIFKAREACTPSAWRDRQSARRAGGEEAEAGGAA